MIKFFRRIRQNLLSNNKISKYLLYVLGEIILVMIGILLALQVNNWNQKQLEKKQIRNIYARIVQDFKHSATEIKNDIAQMTVAFSLMDQIINEDVDRDSLLANSDYFNTYYNSISGYPDIKIMDTGIRLLESKIELNYELNNDLTEAFSLLYSEHLFEIETDAIFLNNMFIQLITHGLIEKGTRVDYFVHKDRTTFANMVFEDDMFKNHLFAYSRSHRAYSNLLSRFVNKGEVLMEQIKTEYNLE